MTAYAISHVFISTRIVRGSGMQQLVGPLAPSLTITGNVGVIGAVFPKHGLLAGER